MSNMVQFGLTGRDAYRSLCLRTELHKFVFQMFLQDVTRICKCNNNNNTLLFCLSFKRSPRMRVRGDDLGRGNRDPLWPLIAQNLFLLGQQRPLLLFILGLFKQTSLQIL